MKHSKSPSWKIVNQVFLCLNMIRELSHAPKRSFSLFFSKNRSDNKKQRESFFASQKDFALCQAKKCDFKKLIYTISKQDELSTKNLYKKSQRDFSHFSDVHTICL